MGDLERLFVGTMMVTGMLILGLFGLYFDVGAMTAGAFGRKGLTFSQGQDRIREARLQAVAPRKDVARARVFRRGRGAAAPANYGRYATPQKTHSLARRIDDEIKSLMATGIIDEEYLKARAIYEHDTSLTKLYDEYDRLIAAGDYAGAIRVLSEAREHLDPANLYALRDLLGYLYEAHVYAADDAGATKIVGELGELEEKILALEERAEIDSSPQMADTREKIRQSIRAAKDASRDPDAARLTREARDSATKFIRGRGPLVMPSQDAAAQVKAKLLGQGELTPEIQRMIDTIEVRPPTLE